MNPPANARVAGSIPGLGWSPGVGNGNPLQYPCLENSRTEEAGGLQSMGSQRVGHDWAWAHTHILSERSNFNIALNWKYTEGNNINKQECGESDVLRCSLIRTHFQETIISSTQSFLPRILIIRFWENSHSNNMPLKPKQCGYYQLHKRLVSIWWVISKMMKVFQVLSMQAGKYIKARIIYKAGWLRNFTSFYTSLFDSMQTSN